jgi:Glyoxalase/Bleomycin resistance protein/Dioxygenase superfamily
METEARHEVRWMFHSTAMVPDYDLACARLSELAGLVVIEYSEAQDPAVGRRGGMTWIGDNSLEIGEPIVESGGAARFVNRTGGGVHSVALQVANVEGTIEHLERHGVAIAARPDEAFCFSDPRHTGGVFFEWFAGEVPEDPRYGGTLSEPSSRPLLAVTRQAFVGAVVDQPSRWAERFAALLGTDVLFDNSGSSPDRPEAAVSLKDNVLALYRLPEEDSRQLWGVDLPRSRTHLVSLQVPQLAGAEDLLTGGGFGIVRSADDAIVLDPATTGGIGVILVENLLPNDPRLSGLARSL